MSFTGNKTNRGYAPGWFLAEEKCSRETVQVAANHAQAITLADGSKIVPMGAVIPANGSTAKGILYEDVEVTNGDMPGSLVTRGVIYSDRLPAALDSAAASALTGITVKTVPSVTRPETGDGELEEIEVSSAAGTAVGDTAITIDYTPGTGETLVYKVGTAAPAVGYNQPLDYTWTAWDGSSDITAQTGKKIGIAAVDENGRAVAYGSATVTAKA